MTRVSIATLVGSVWLTGCVRDAAEETARARLNDSAVSTAAVPAAPRCFQSAHSVLLGPSKQVQGRDVTGWLRLTTGSVPDSGSVELIDGDGTDLQGTWQRLPNDSVAVIAFDDFLRVQMRLRLAPDRIEGQGSAHSDAALERDSAGRQVELRRSWSVSARAASCDSVPSAR
ncbi:MAG TPA: hypothetical protein VJ672_15070 [Gemmatimonadaceae bacterium]|nr:hypothetical protein [Gemmatimonadaceae bacterium]